MLRLGALEALTYEGRLVKNPELMRYRIRYRLEEIDIQIEQKTNEAGEELRLLAVIERPAAIVAGRLGADRAPAVDVGALERFLKNDYVGPVVAKISKLHSEIQELEAERGRLRKQLGSLPATTRADARLPAGHKELARQGIGHAFLGQTAVAAVS